MALNERLLWSVLISIFCSICLYLGATSKNRMAAMSTLSTWKDKAGALFGLIMFTHAAASFSANTFGTLVQIFPAEPYAARFRVVGAEKSGSKYKSIDLELKSSKDNNIYYLTLSKRLFDYSNFQYGDEVLLKGKQNFIGIYVEAFEMQK